MINFLLYMNTWTIGVSKNISMFVKTINIFIIGFYTRQKIHVIFFNRLTLFVYNINNSH